MLVHLSMDRSNDDKKASSFDDRKMLDETYAVRPVEPSRRGFLTGTAAVVGVAALLKSQEAEAADNAGPSLAASPPAGFTPFNAPGFIVKVTKTDSLQPNKMYPKADDAKAMLTKVLTELTGKPDLVSAVKEFVHPADKVVVKVNGIALRKMSSNVELVAPFVQAMIDGGVPADSITVLEQWSGYLDGTRINAASLPNGVKINIHNNTDATMKERLIPGTGTRTKFVRALTEATAAINFSLIKDHSAAGYTGCMKNMTHGCQIVPEYFHHHRQSPQIAFLYAQDVVKSRVRLNIADAFKIMAHGGPKATQPQHIYPYESVFATTDPVAMDAIGWDLVEKFRADKGLHSLTADGREPIYIKTAGDLGLGVFDRSQIKVKELTI